MDYRNGRNCNHSVAGCLDMGSANPESIAAALRAAYASGAIAPIRELLPLGDVQAAYAVQEANTRYWLNSGRTLVGRKIGLTSKAVQQQLGVDQPDYGMLFADMALKSGEHVPEGRLIQPKVEAEVAIFLNKDLTAERIEAAELIAAVGALAPAIEIADSRIQRWQISLVDTIADNASSGMFVVGAERRSFADIDVVGCEMILTCDGENVSEGSGAACLGSPYISAQWLAQKMVEVGRPLLRGDVILTGALGPMVVAAKGRRYKATITGLGEVEVSF